jgi:ElaA protein
MAEINSNKWQYDIPSDCQLHIKTFDQLTTSELYELLRVRSEVFVVEQDCVYQDVDNNDQTAIHIWLTKGDKTVAMCRICPEGTKLASTSIGRVITTERGKGYGMQIMKIAINTVMKRIPAADHIEIEAQLTKQKFYERLGFVATSEPFMMEGLMHLEMKLNLK